MDIFFEIHSGNLREGPGSFESTQRAFTFCNYLPLKPNILDIGCGPGQQSIDLAKLSGGHITAVDNHQPFLDGIITKINDQKFKEKIKVFNGDMFNLELKSSSFDIIWSEGAIYIIGFKKGLKEWKSLLKPKGYLAVSHISWLKDNPPEELYKFWHEAYPAISTIKKNLNLAKECGYNIIEHFTLPESDWADSYYKPIEMKLDSLQKKYKNDAEAIEVINMEQKEIELYKKYSDYYGYEFYIMQK